VNTLFVGKCKFSFRIQCHWTTCPVMTTRSVLSPILSSTLCCAHMPHSVVSGLSASDGSQEQQDDVIDHRPLDVGCRVTAALGYTAAALSGCALTQLGLSLSSFTRFQLCAIFSDCWIISQLSTGLHIRVWKRSLPTLSRL
jgi:hypothetical protein